MITNPFVREEDLIPPTEMSPLALAFVGDSVFDLFLRTRIVQQQHISPKAMHLEASSFANARAQAVMARLIRPELEEEEEAEFLRGRNARSNTSSKHASIVDYRNATGLEALWGYLYLCRRTERLNELMLRCVQLFSEECSDSSLQEEENE